MAGNLDKVILALETTQTVCSVSLLKGRAEVGFLLGKEKVSKSENVLELIEEVLRITSLKKKDLDVISVSEGPGSQTGIRIGLSIAKGLSDALGVECFSAGLLDAMRSEFNVEAGKDLTAVLIGKDLICYKVFNNERILGKGKCEQKVCNFTEFREVLKVFFDTGGCRVFGSEVVYNILVENGFVNSGQVILTSVGLSRLVGLFAFQRLIDLEKKEI